jgi:cell fate (sporulation/competence/biofilm development) regulator YlbF (YheA/YmcA/DUF963 family)
LPVNPIIIFALAENKLRRRAHVANCFCPAAVIYCPRKINFMPTKIEEKTRELCQTLVAQPEMLAIRKRIDTFMADTSARSQYESLMGKGQTLHEKQHNGQPLAPAEVSDFETSRETLLKNPVASGFLDAQEELHAIQNSIQKQITKTLELGRLPTAEDLDEGSCGHGCGCHH